MNYPIYSSFPVTKSRYQEITGKLLPHTISKILKEIGFKTRLNHVQTNGVDLKVFNVSNEIVLVAEILNWSIKSRMGKQRIHSIINNLTKHNCYRILIYTTMVNEQILDKVIKAGISIIKLDYQILPRSFFEFFETRDQIIARTAISANSKQYIKNKLLLYLDSINLKPQSLKPKDERLSLAFQRNVRELL